MCKWQAEDIRQNADLNHFRCTREARGAEKTLACGHETNKGRSQCFLTIPSSKLKDRDTVVNLRRPNGGAVLDEWP